MIVCVCVSYHPAREEWLLIYTHAASAATYTRRIYSIVMHHEIEKRDYIFPLTHKAHFQFVAGTRVNYCRERFWSRSKFFIRIHTHTHTSRPIADARAGRLCWQEQIRLSPRLSLYPFFFALHSRIVLIAHSTLIEIFFLFFLCLFVCKCEYLYTSIK